VKVASSQKSVGRGIVVCTLLLTLSFLSEAQQTTKVPRIGFLRGGSASSSAAAAQREAFRQGLRDLGYIEAKTSALSTVMLREWMSSQTLPWN